MAGAVWADNGEVEKLAAHYEERLDAMGFFFPVQKAGSMRLNLRNFWSRMPMTRADVQMMHGILRQVSRWAARQE
jgi:tRNA/rRNA methyltransferase